MAVTWLALACGRGQVGQAPSSRVRVPPGALRVLDGDTFALRGEVIRLLAVDAPERAAPWFEGDQEPHASAARALVVARLAGAREVELVTLGARDGRGRLLGHVLLDGVPLAAELSAAGLAYPTSDRYGDGGFPAWAAEVRRRARPPPFEPPWRWRREHRRPQAGPP